MVGDLTSELVQRGVPELLADGEGGSSIGVLIVVVVILCLGSFGEAKDKGAGYYRRKFREWWDKDAGK